MFEEAKRHFGIDGGVFAKRRAHVGCRAGRADAVFLGADRVLSVVSGAALGDRKERRARSWFLPGKIVSNGAFRLADWRVGNRIRLERSATYWGRADVQLNTVDVLPIENGTTALNLYLTGDVDWMPNGSYPQDLGARPEETQRFFIGPALITYYYRIN